MKPVVATMRLRLYELAAARARVPTLTPTFDEMATQPLDRDEFEFDNSYPHAS